MYDDPLPPLPSHVLCQVFCDELSALLQLIADLGSAELQDAAKARMFSLPERVRQQAQAEGQRPNLN